LAAKENAMIEKLNSARARWQVFRVAGGEAIEIVDQGVRVQ
jgi:hypothetical protein